MLITQAVQCRLMTKMAELLYYNRPYAAPSRINGDENQLAAFNILNEIANSSQDINSSGVSLNATVNYNLFDFFKINARHFPIR